MVSKYHMKKFKPLYTMVLDTKHGMEMYYKRQIQTETKDNKAEQMHMIFGIYFAWCKWWMLTYIFELPGRFSSGHSEHKLWKERMN